MRGRNIIPRRRIHEGCGQVDSMVLGPTLEGAKPTEALKGLCESSLPSPAARSASSMV